MPAEWTATQIAAQVHREVLAPLGFTRAGTACTRVDSHLARTITFYAPRSTTPLVQLHVRVVLLGLPPALTDYRRDHLWGHPKGEHGWDAYRRPPRGVALPAMLLADVAGPAVEFLTRAETLEEFVAWAQEIYAGDQHRGWWRRFRPVMPQGTSPLQAAAYAAALMGDKTLTVQFTDQVLTDERDADERARFQAELRRLPAPKRG